MFESYTEHFQSVADLLHWRDTEEPMPSHPSLIPAWKESAMDDMMMAANEEANTKFTAVQELACQVLEKFLQAAKSSSWNNQSPEDRLQYAKSVLERPQIPQRTPAWYEQGKQVLTASEFSGLFGTPRAVGQLVLHKVPAALVPPGTEGPSQTNRLACRSCDMGPFDWGIRFEPVLKQVLSSSSFWGVEIAEAGRILSATDPNLAASPDGILLAASDPLRVGRLLELKCPITRKIGAGIPFDYWCQMQIQMEVTGIGECEYVEAKFESLTKTISELAPLPEGAPKPIAEGQFWLFQNENTLEMRYAYTDDERYDLHIPGWIQIEMIPWRLIALYTETIVRDTTWYASTEEKRAAFWKDVQKARAGTYVAAPSSKSPRVVVTKEPASCQILDD
jgi:hypothetical protein